jgi:hypothetical protein
MKTTIIRNLFVSLFALLSFSKSNAQSFTEVFNDITTLAGNGWVMTNASAAVGSTNWFQGNNTGAGGPFDAFNGAANAYIAANYNNTGNTGTISNWLITPNRTFRNGDVITFYTRKPSPDSYADRLEVRLSTNGTSTAVGSGTTVGDFTTLLLSVNPSLTLGVYPTSWTQYTVTVSGLSAPTSGRIAFRYFVTGAGLSGTNSDYIGIDNVVYTPYVCPSFTLTTGGALTGAVAGSAYSTTLTQTGALGAPNFAVTAGALPPGLLLSSAGTIAGTPTATGTFNFTVTVNDASGCSGSQSYSITTICPSNPLAFNGIPVLCDNAADYTLVEASPLGGVYTGTGVTGGVFDPSAGTQTITYDYTDIYGCSFNSNYVINVSVAPTVSLSPISAICDNSGVLSLSGESPAGGLFSGTGVTGTDFDPTVGSQTITYSYTDGSGCTNVATQFITVNAAPIVSHDTLASICENAGVQVISGGIPAAGSYAGIGITGTDFDPSVGSQVITYTYTDSNSCTASTTLSIDVIPSETAFFGSVPATCNNTGLITLTQGTPIGGVYAGVGVNGDQFDPTVGTQTISYIIGSGTACESTSDQVITVYTSPSVSLSMPMTHLCDYNDDFILTGGIPTGGIYSGVGVNAGSFSPSSFGLGSTPITYLYADSNGCSNSASELLIVDGCAGIENNGLFNLTVSPNPSNGTFILSNPDAWIISSIEVVDLNGKVIPSNIQIGANSQLSVSIEEAEIGIYLLTGSVNDQLVQIRLMKQ